MDLTQFIASSSRCYEVEAEELPDFTALTSVKLRKEMDLRKISRHGMIAKAQYVEALTNHLLGLRHELQVRDPQ
jgi:hypothetical protein